MFENIFHRQEKPHEEIRANFKEQEEAIEKEAGDFIENLEPEKFKNRAANLLLAFSLFAGASSAFAGEQKINNELPGSGEEQIEQTAEKNKIANFDWKKISGKIEIAAGVKEKTSTGHFEAVDFTSTSILEKSEFYRGASIEQLGEVLGANYYAINDSHSARDFFKKIATSEGGYNDRQKALALQHIGAVLAGTFNYDMMSSGERVAVSSDKMFKSLREQYLYGDGSKSGVCGNIHAFLSETARNLGIEAGLITGAREKGNHVWSYLVLGDGAEKQITFLDYGTLIPTGTLNYKDALGISEKYNKAVTTFNSFAGNERGVLIPVKSNAGEVVGEAIGDETSSNKLKRNMEEGTVSREENGLEIKISPNIKEIKLNYDNLGLSFYNFQDVQNNPYQSIENLTALRGEVGLGGEKFGIEGSATVMQMNIKDLYGETLPTSEIAATIMADYIDKKEFTKKEYGQFIAEFGATISGAMMVPLGKKEGNISRYIEGKGDASVGGRLIYLDPSNNGKFYVDASESVRGQKNDQQNQDNIIKKVATNLNIGSEVKVFEGSVMNIEAGRGSFDWGKSSNAKIGIEGKNLSGNIEYEKNNSEFERFIPSSEKIEVGVNYKGGPKWEVGFVGSKVNEEYKGGESMDKYSAEVKMKIMLW